MEMLLCPSKYCTAFGGNSRPPLSFELMHQLAKKCRMECRPYFGSPFLSRSFAACITELRLRSIFLWCSIWPVLVQKTKSSWPLCSLLIFQVFKAAFSTSLSGNVRTLELDLGAPTLL